MRPKKRSSVACDFLFRLFFCFKFVVEELLFFKIIFIIFITTTTASGESICVTQLFRIKKSHHHHHNQFLLLLLYNGRRRRRRPDSRVVSMDWEGASPRVRVLLARIFLVRPVLGGSAVPKVRLSFRANWKRRETETVVGERF